MNRRVLGVVLVSLTAGTGGYLLGANASSSSYSDAPTPPVHVSVTYDDVNEIAGVELTDSNGHDVEVGSIAESWPDDNTDTDD